MSIFEIIVIGYIVNILAFMFVSIILLVTTLFNMLSYENRVDMAKYVLETETLINDIKELLKSIKSYKRIEYDMLFPFVQLIKTSKFLFYMTKYGILTASVIMLREKKARLEILKKEEQCTS